MRLRLFQMATKRLRIIVYVVIFGLLAGGGYYAWQQLPPQRVKTLLAELEHPNAMVASAAWRQLQHLYFTDWSAFYLVLDEMQSKTPISFLIEQSKPKNAESGDDIRFVVNDRALFYKTEQVFCKTIGEALMAIAHNDPKRRSAYSGDWLSWWKENRQALQSGR